METEIIITIILILISFTISMFGSVVGFGGGIFMVPILIAVFHFPLTTAVGSVMISLLPSSLISTFLNRKEGFVDFKMGVLLEVPTILGVFIGVLLLSYITAVHLEVLFAVMVLFLGISFFLKKEKNKKGQGFFYMLNKLKPRYIIKNHLNHAAYRFSVWMVLFFGLMAGTLAGLFGIGGGFLKTPIMLRVFKMPAKIATATALFMIVITSTTGSISHFMLGHVQFSEAWPIMLGFALGALGGQKLNLKIKNATLEKLIGMGLVLAALVMMSNFIINR
ncbi:MULTISPECIES: sulfite exporter TauE/SafE family protein [Galbibacter]|uniref:Probable membrane transporter protein n=1 Tax=Galbibacter pacificus TaxID=2996052 RepID=A0ABT6FQP5_9FLAO|nr:sulfite exporter TauE/SafE family protein [Galbibacter pacificus]MDG3581943.1 sulfite exporter TauE/SafE family protein [Galbibacter pacificus]MDG3585583.1 sulfite exporter TauE/SafE family protein [Galbibacter pacificus]